MKLEDIVDMYGWNDYLDMDTGNTYVLSEAKTIGEMSKVPVISAVGLFIGHVKVDKVKEVSK